MGLWAGCEPLVEAIVHSFLMPMLRIAGRRISCESAIIQCRRLSKYADDDRMSDPCHCFRHLMVSLETPLVLLSEWDRMCKSQASPRAHGTRQCLMHVCHEMFCMFYAWRSYAVAHHEHGGVSDIAVIGTACSGIRSKYNVQITNRTRRHAMSHPMIFLMHCFSFTDWTLLISPYLDGAMRRRKLTFRGGWATERFTHTQPRGYDVLCTDTQSALYRVK